MLAGVLLAAAPISGIAADDAGGWAETSTNIEGSPIPQKD